MRSCLYQRMHSPQRLHVYIQLRPERWSIFQGDGMVMVFSPTMEWRCFLKILTITIDGMVPAQPLAAMVFQWFFQF